jgi:creatinine amidohydrolase
LIKVELEKMTWPEVAERVKDDPLTPVVVLFSSTEQHGRHLPLNTDAFATRKLWVTAAELTADEVKPVLTPMVPFDVAWEHMGYPGTVTLTRDTMTRVAKDIVRSLYLGTGFRKFVLVPGCDGQGPAIAMQVAALELYEEFGPEIALFLWSGVMAWSGGSGGAFATAHEIESLTKKMKLKAKEWMTEHAGESETSTALAWGNPDVNMKAAINTDVKREWVGLPSDTEWEWFKKLNPFATWPFPRFKERGQAVADAGSIGAATLGTKEKGKPATELSVQQVVRFLRWYKKVKMPSAPPPEHRYLSGP